MKAVIPILIAVVALLGIRMVAEFDRPPIVAEQSGFRGTGMEQVQNPRIAEDLVEANQPPDSFGPTEPGGPLASEIYENVEVLGDLTENEFTALMISITNWVSPEQGCAYCHNDEGNFAAEDNYAKHVARRMLLMTKTINSEWQDHVANTGVNCYTCHRGQPRPEYVWYKDDVPPESEGGFNAKRNDQNIATEVAVYSSLPYSALEETLLEDGQIRVAGGNALPIVGQPLEPIQRTERTYSLMMHMSDSLGVNCTYCHNTRAFSNWEESPPVRTSAWYGIRMARMANNEYVAPLAELLPEAHRGPTGDAGKVSCMTCHQGVAKPMYGAPMLEDHPTLGEAPN
jgi:photosynthetic reaction center cytochrome c subunit